MAVLVGALARRRGTGADSVTAIVLVGSLALGVVLASDVFDSRRASTRCCSAVAADRRGGPRLAAAAALAVALAALVIGPRWLATGLPAISGRAARRRRRADAVLLALVALVVVAALAAVGALLATALLVVPAATTRLLVDGCPAGSWRPSH